MFHVKRQNNRVVKKIKRAKRVNLITHYSLLATKNLKNPNGKSRYSLLATKYLKYDIKRNS